MQPYNLTCINPDHSPEPLQALSHRLTRLVVSWPPTSSVVVAELDATTRTAWAWKVTPVTANLRSKVVGVGTAEVRSNLDTCAAHAGGDHAAQPIQLAATARVEQWLFALMGMQLRHWQPDQQSGEPGLPAKRPAYDGSW